MKVLLVCLTFCGFAFTLNSQSFEGTVKFTHIVTVKNKKDSLKLYNAALYDKDLIFNSNYDPYRSICYIKHDSILIEKYYSKKEDPDFYIYQKDSMPLLIDNSTGKVSKYKFYGRFRAPKFKIKKKVKNILGYECHLHKAENDKMKIELWITKELKIDKNREAFKKYNYNGFFILEQQYYYKLRGTKLHTIATNFEIKTPKNIYPKIKEIKEKDFSEKLYAPISQNSSYAETAIKIGDTLANLFYREVNSFEILPFYRFKNNGKYLLIEFWGTWCAPCLRATPKIKEFYKKNSATIDILSLNFKDTRYDRIKLIISKKNMTWAQGFATEKIISILNSRRAYPTMVLLNDDMEVLFIGNPGVHLNKAQEIIHSM